jgi:diaminopimelate epimerase
MIPAGRPFYKMSGSGNDFVVVDARREPPGRLAEPLEIQRVCARGTGVGADGIVFLEPSTAASIRLTYLNADGSLAEFCGNATLCTTRLSAELGIGPPGGLVIETDSGLVSARIGEWGPEIDLQPVSEVSLSPNLALAAGELRMGYAVVGVPHLVIECDDVSTVDVVGRGRPLRHDARLPRGANVNFVSRQGSRQGSDGAGWRMRTYERGVEAETLACGSGAVATAILLTLWGRASGVVELETSSGRALKVRLREAGGVWHPTLIGEGRVVFEGRLSEI